MVRACAEHVLGVMTMVKSIINGVPYVCFSCPARRQIAFHRFSPFQRFRSGYPASRMDTGSSSCDGGSARTRIVSVPIHNLPALRKTSDF